MDSPADIVRSCLVGLGIVVMPGIANQTLPFQQEPGDGSTLCYVSSMPDEIDQCIGLFDQSGVVWGRTRDKKIAHPGVKVLIRSLDYQRGYALAQTIALAIDNGLHGIETVLNGTTYTIANIYRTTGITSLGEEVGKKRQLWSINLRVALAYSTPFLG